MIKFLTSSFICGALLLTQFFVLLIAIIISSCEKKPIEYEYKLEIVQAKTIDFKNGTTRYNIAYESGLSESFTFGLYTKYNVGDTICFKREKNWFWKIIDCPENDITLK
jgi:hypothetical protein